MPSAGTMDAPLTFQTDYLDEHMSRSNFLTQYVISPTLQPNDFWITARALILFLISRLILCGAMRWSRICRTQCIIPRLTKQIVKPKRELKLSENLWYLMWHVSSLIWGLYVLRSEAMTPERPGWPRLLFTGWFEDRWYFHATPAELALGQNGWPLLHVSDIVRIFYLTQLGFWASCLAYVWIETQRRDFTVFFIHHSATCILITFSYICNYWRLGIFIVIIHDSADVFLYLAKFLNYTKAPERIVDVNFYIFVFVFCLSRLFIFPIYCVSPFVNPERFRKWAKGTNLKSLWDVPGGVALPSFLFLLQLLHIFWFTLIIKMIFRTLESRNKHVDRDIRSDDEEDDEHLPTKKDESGGDKAVHMKDR